MFVRMKTGAHAGEVEEVEYETGKILVSDGRAEQVFFDDRAKTRQRTQTTQPAKTSKPKGKKR